MLQPKCLLASQAASKTSRPYTFLTVCVLFQFKKAIINNFCPVICITAVFCEYIPALTPKQSCNI